MPRLCRPAGRAGDAANAVLFPASNEAGVVNGTTSMVEGGAAVLLPSVGAPGATRA